MAPMIKKDGSVMCRVAACLKSWEYSPVWGAFTLPTLAWVGCLLRYVPMSRCTQPLGPPPQTVGLGAIA
jgi:hypothetical protein